MIHILALVVVGNVVRIDTGELRLAIHHHQHLTGRRTSHATHLDAAATTIADAETEDVALRHEEAWHTAGQCREQLRATCGFNLILAHYRHGVWQQPARCGIVGSRHHHLAQRVSFLRD